jgi:hypothetical protein
MGSAERKCNMQKRLDSCRINNFYDYQSRNADAASPQQQQFLLIETAL